MHSPLKNSDYFIGWGSSDGGRSPDSIKNPSPPDIDYSLVEAMLEMTRKARDKFRILYPEGSVEKLTYAELEKVWTCPRKWSSAKELRMGTTESPIWTLGEPPLMPLPLGIGNLIPEDTLPWEVHSGIVAISLAFSPLRLETSSRNYVIYMCNRENGAILFLRKLCIYKENNRP